LASALVVGVAALEVAVEVAVVAVLLMIIIMMMMMMMLIKVVRVLVLSVFNSRGTNVMCRQHDYHFDNADTWCGLPRPSSTCLTTSREMFTGARPTAAGSRATRTSRTGPLQMAQPRCVCVCVSVCLYVCVSARECLVMRSVRLAFTAVRNNVQCALFCVRTGWYGRRRATCVH
jgi:hypothetical protein